MKLLIRNLSRATTEQEIKKLFESFGRIQSCSLVIDEKTGASKGFSFVEMPMIGEAKAAMKALNGKEIDGNKIRVKKAELKSESIAVISTLNSLGKTPNKDLNEKVPGQSIWEKRRK